jgi:phage replication O-like protein O
MASPQVENGFSRIANELMEQFARRDFSKRAYAVLWVVLRNTYGYHRTSYPYSSRTVADASGLHISHVREAVTSLVGAGVFTLADGQIGINKDHEEWTLADRVKEASQNGSLESQISSPKGEPKQLPASASRGAETAPQGEPKQLEKRAETALHTPLNAPDTNGFQVPKDKRKERKDEEDRSSSSKSPPETEAAPKGSRDWGFSEEDLAILKLAGEGTHLGPVELANRIGLHLVAKVREETLALAALQAFHQMPAAKAALWIKAGMAMAREKTRNQAANTKYAASVIGGHLESKTDLLAPAATKASPSSDPNGLWTKPASEMTPEERRKMYLSNERSKH